MGVYIYMEMPPDGRYTLCITHDSNGCVHWVFQNQDTLEFLKHGAVTKVTETHGRMIDADKLAFELMDAKNTDQALAMVDDAPTIIEAEE